MRKIPKVDSPLDKRANEMTTLYEYSNRKTKESQELRAKLIERFGRVEGHRMFYAGFSYEQALEHHCDEQAKRIKQLTAQVDQARSRLANSHRWN